MWTDAFAQAQAASEANPAVSTLQRQRQKQLEKMIKALKKGDRVLTSGGIFGTVVGIDDSKAVLRIAEDIKVEFSKGSIVQVLAGDAK
jgi:preprotein translocase subunit YajC